MRTANAGEGTARCQMLRVTFAPGLSSFPNNSSGKEEGRRVHPFGVSWFHASVMCLRRGLWKLWHGTVRNTQVLGSVCGVCSGENLKRLGSLLFPSLPLGHALHLIIAADCCGGNFVNWIVFVLERINFAWCFVNNFNWCRLSLFDKWDCPAFRSFAIHCFALNSKKKMVCLPMIPAQNTSIGLIGWSVQEIHFNLALLGWDTGRVDGVTNPVPMTLLNYTVRYCVLFLSLFLFVFCALVRSYLVFRFISPSAINWLRKYRFPFAAI